MMKPTNLIPRFRPLTCLLAVTGIFLLYSAAEARIVRPGHASGSGRQLGGTEIVLEAGMVLPLLDLKNDYWTTAKGISATTGYELGVRLRQPLGASWAISPSFHFVDFGEASGVGNFPQGDGLAYEMDASLYRYGLEMHVFSGLPGAPVRPYLIGGAALVHYRYRDVLQYNGVYETSFNGPGFSAGLGLKMGSIEVSGVYNFYRFDSSELPPGLERQHYLWDHVVVRVGLAFGD